MAIHLPRPRHGLTLFSTSELARLLNIPDSRMAKAIRDGTIRPLGTVGCVTLIGLTEEEIDDLRRLLSAPRTAHADMAT
jgi:hypothetical protein